MSDKHTDALDLDKLEALARAADEEANGRGEWFNLYQIADGITLDASASLIAEANPAVILQLIAKIRATEGQAQTSAAVGEYLTCCDHPDCSKCAGRGGIFRVADSTAPGAPDPAAAQFKIPGETWEACGIDEEEAMRARGYKFRYLYSAPAAQQSLTAGGAVLEGWVIEYDKHTSPGTIRMSSPKWGGCFLGKPTSSDTVLSTLMYRYFADQLAAAPLPQVQSEALDADAVLERAACIAETEICACCWEDDATAAAEHIAATIRAAKSDQQPVTPSGARADNDGGVA